MIESHAQGRKKDESFYRVAGAANLRRYGQFFKKLSDKNWQEFSDFDHIIEGPIRLVYNVKEEQRLLSIAKTENKFFFKLLATTAGLSREVSLVNHLFSTINK